MALLPSQGSIKFAILQALEEINNSVFIAREKGLMCLLPEALEITVTGPEISIQQISAGIETVTQVDSPVATTESESAQIPEELVTTIKGPESSTEIESQGQSVIDSEETVQPSEETQTVTHPGVVQSSGGGDSSATVTERTYTTFPD